MLNHFIGQTRSNADRHALHVQGRAYTYAWLGARTASIQQFLDSHFPAETVIGVEASDHPDTYAALMALLLSGKAYVPLHPDNPADRNAAILSQAGIHVVLSGNAEAARTSCPEGTMIADLRLLQETEEVTPEYRAKPEDIAYILFTSGSTGLPKGVPITHANVYAFLQAFEALGTEVTPGDRFLQMFDLTFDLSVMSYLVPLLHGACFYTVPAGEIKFMAVYRQLEEHDITIALMVPSVLTYLRSYFEDIQLPAMRHSLFCGEALHHETALEWKACVPNATVFNVYGPTEATIFCTAAKLEEAGSYNGTTGIGRAMQGMSCVVFDDNLKPLLSPGQKGELCLAGPQLTPGYLDNPEKNSQAFFFYEGYRFYRTGDIVFADEAGDLLYCGRMDHQVKVMGGYRVELGEIEHQARIFLSHCNAVAVAVPNESGISQVFLFTENYGTQTAGLSAHLAGKLPSYMLPTGIYDLNSFPLNTNGKTDRKALASLVNSFRSQQVYDHS